MSSLITILTIVGIVLGVILLAVIAVKMLLENCRHKRSSHRIWSW